MAGAFNSVKSDSVVLVGFNGLKFLSRYSIMRCGFIRTIAILRDQPDGFHGPGY